MITTFKNFGKLKIPVTELPVNQADKNAAYMIATGVIPSDETITGDLYDINDNLITTKRVYFYSGIRKNSPFISLDFGKEGYLSGEKPEDKWGLPEIKLWLSDRQTKDEAGIVVKDDLYAYKETDAKTVLLSKIEPQVIEK
jgi:hypothetical protein